MPTDPTPEPALEPTANPTAPPAAFGVAAPPAEPVRKRGTNRGDERANPAWLGKLSQRDEARRRAVGLYPAKDGWYKWVDKKKCYIAKPMSLSAVLQVLDARLQQIKGQIQDRPARLAVGSTTIENLADMYIAHLWHRHTTGQPRKLSRRTYDDYVDVVSRFVEVVGCDKPAISADTDWFTAFARSIARKAATSRRREIIYLTAFFNWAGPGRHSLNFYKQPVSFGPDLVKPGEEQISSAINDSSTLYTPEQYFGALMAVRDCPLLYAVGLLGLNCAFLPVDMTSLPDSKIDLDAGIHTFPRGKNGIQRKAVLMPETVRALRDYLSTRPQRPEGCDQFFVRDDGRPFSQRRQIGPDERGAHGNAIATYWSTITGLPLKGLRTTFATAADGLSDDSAIDLVMGHRVKTIRGKHYVKHFEPERLRSVIEHVWLQYVSALPLPSGARVSAFQLRHQVEQRAGTPSRS